MSDQIITSPILSVELQEKFINSTEKTQLQLIPELVASQTTGLEFLINWLQENKTNASPIVLGTVYQALYQSGVDEIFGQLIAAFPTGIVPLNSALGVDYLPLQKLLAEQDFEEADRLTSIKLCELAGSDAKARKWVYFTEVDSFPVDDLITLDHLWLVHSQGKFGFSVQRELWLGVGKNWDKLWPKIGWKNGTNWTRYPGSFTWNLSAPRGHLPLSNQLRGVRVMAALMNHPAWNK